MQNMLETVHVRLAAVEEMAVRQVLAVRAGDRRLVSTVVGRTWRKALLSRRRADEHDAARIDGAVNIPLHELVERVAEVPPGEVWVHCAGGYRASVAASVLDAAGRSLVAVDDTFDNAEKVGLQLVGPEA